jgi:hypothetical protein
MSLFFCLSFRQFGVLGFWGLKVLLPCVFQIFYDQVISEHQETFADVGFTD